MICRSVGLQIRMCSCAKTHHVSGCEFVVDVPKYCEHLGIAVNLAKGII